MLIIGEKINSTRKRIKEAISARDTEYLQNLAISQADAGADYLDVNTGAFPSEEVQLMEWLVEVVQAVVDVPLAIDSANPAALEAGLKLHKNGTPLINSITIEETKFNTVLPLVKAYEAKVLSLAIGDEGITKTADERFDVAGRLIEALCGGGIEPNRIYLDPLIQPVSVQNDFGLIALDVIRRVKQEFPQVKTTCGLSNISFGLPKRVQFNKTFLIMAMAAGLDSAILDPLDDEIINAITISNAMLGRDRFCKKYIKAFR
jgi:5-methyltetrahydrofolate--homocysteine methyltransferase